MIKSTEITNIVYTIDFKTYLSSRYQQEKSKLLQK